MNIEKSFMRDSKLDISGCSSIVPFKCDLNSRFAFINYVIWTSFAWSAAYRPITTFSRSIAVIRVQNLKRFAHSLNQRALSLKMSMNLHRRTINLSRLYLAYQDDENHAGPHKRLITTSIRTISSLKPGKFAFQLFINLIVWGRVARESKVLVTLWKQKESNICRLFCYHSLYHRYRNMNVAKYYFPFKLKVDKLNEGRGEKGIITSSMEENTAFIIDLTPKICELWPHFSLLIYIWKHWSQTLETEKECFSVLLQAMGITSNIADW